MIPKKLAQLIRTRPSIVRQHRHVTNASLDYLSAAGSQFFIRDHGQASAGRRALVK